MSWLIFCLLGFLHAASFTAPHLPGWLTALIQLLSFSALSYLVFTHKTRSKSLKVWLFGTVSFSCSLYWLYVSMHFYGGMPSWLAILAVILFGVYLSAYLALASFIFLYKKGYSYVQSDSFRGVLFSSLAWAALVTLAEMGRGYVFTGFPWNNIAYAYVDTTLVAFAPIGGVYSITFIVALLSAFLANLVLHFKNKHIRKDISGSLLLLIVLSVLVGFIRWSSPFGSPIPVRLVQGNIALAEKFNQQTQLNGLFSQLNLASLKSKTAVSPPRVVIFPETTLPILQDTLNPAYWQYIIQKSAIDEATYFIGAPIRRFDNQNNTTLTNGILYIDRQTRVNQLYDKSNLKIYDKKHLVPFGEFIPWGFRWFVDLMHIPLGDFDKGLPNQMNFVVDDQVFGPNICYEDIFGEELLSALYPQIDNPGATILFNESNLGWFGNTITIWQHLQQSRVRSLETARPMLRATNTGVTAYINEQGQVVAQLPPFKEGILDVSVQGMQGYTWYARTGNLPIFLLCVLILILIRLRRPLI